MQASRPLRPHTQFSEVFRINTPAPVVWHDLQASKVESIPISGNFSIRWSPRVGGKSWTSSQKKFQSAPQCHTQATLGWEENTRGGEFFGGVKRFFSKLLVDSSPRKTSKCPPKNNDWKELIFPFSYLAPFLRGHSFVFGGCKITFTCPCAGDFRVVASRWVNPLHIWSFGDGFITVKP